MQSKLQELTDKLYNEGVQKANQEAEIIIEKAQEEAGNIIEEAKKYADEILKGAKEQASEISRKIESEIKLSSAQAISTLRQQIGNSIAVQVLEPTLEQLFSSSDYIQNLIIKVVEGWSASGNFDVNLILPEEDKNELDKFLKNSLSAELNKGLAFEFDKNTKAGFKVGPKDGSYIISFTETNFQNFFKSFLRPKTKQLLFE